MFTVKSKLSLLFHLEAYEVEIIPIHWRTELMRLHPFFFSFFSLSLFLSLLFCHAEILSCFPTEQRCEPIKFVLFEKTNCYPGSLVSAEMIMLPSPFVYYCYISFFFFFRLWPETRG